jgi:hypothetical protein
MHNHRGRGKERGRGFAELLEVEELREAWTRRWRRSMVPTMVLGHGGEGWADVMIPRRNGEGRADSAVPRCFDVEEEQGNGMEEERGTGVEVHAEDAEEGMQWRRMRRRSRRRRVCGGEMTWLWFGGSSILKKKNSSDGHDDIINTHHYI